MEQWRPTLFQQGLLDGLLVAAYFLLGLPEQVSTAFPLCGGALCGAVIAFGVRGCSGSWLHNLAPRRSSSQKTMSSRWMPPPASELVQGNYFR